MKKLKLLQRRKKQSAEAKNTLALRGGSYSLILTAVALAILIAVNILVSVLPSGWTTFDISATKLYSITSNTKTVVNQLTEDVTIYWIVQSGQEDDVVENLLGKYENLSDHIQVVKKNPDVFPTFTRQYTDETAENNSLVVECGDRSRFINYDDIYLQESYGYYSYTTSFDGEGAITSAIDYVVNARQPKLYVLTGHGEESLPSAFSDQLTKANDQVESLSLLTSSTVPEDAACVLIYAPASDISQQEAQILADYTASGGKLLVMAGTTESGTLTNLYSLLTTYGVSVCDGVVIDQDSDHYAFQYPYILLPDMAEDTITSSLISEGYYAIMPLSQGMTLSDDSTAAALLTTSDNAYSKADGYDITTYEKEDGDTDGPFALAVSVSADNGGGIIWFSSSAFLEDTYNSYSSGANVNLAMNALSSLIGESEAVAIRSKSLNYNYLTISDTQASVLKAVMIGVLPIVYLGTGVAITIRRRRMQK